MKRKTLDDLLQKPGRVLGTWTQFTDPDLIDALGAAGFDYTIIDCEHGAFGIETAAHLIRACEAAGIAALVRVPRGDTVAAYKALDCGAAGVLAPSVESGEEAQAMVAATRFAPHGTRGACPIVRGADHSMLAWHSFEEQQARTGVIAMIENTKGVQAAQQICATPGLKAVMLGPFDLSVAMGLRGDYMNAAVQRAVHEVIEFAHANELTVFMPVFAPQREALQAQLCHWSACGMRFFAVGADKIIVSQALQQYRAWAIAGEA